MCRPGIGSTPILWAEFHVHTVRQGDIPPVRIVGEDNRIVRLVLGRRYGPRHKRIHPIGADDQGCLFRDWRTCLSLPANADTLPSKRIWSTVKPSYSVTPAPTAASTRSLSRTVRRGARRAAPSSVGHHRS